MKKVSLISTFCNTEEKLEVLKQNIIAIKELGLDVIAISPIPIPQEIVKLCDYFFFTKDNPLLVWPTRMYTHWYVQRLDESKSVVMHRGLADYGWAGLYQVKKLSQLALTFDYDLFYHIIYDLDITDEVKSEFLSNEANVIHARRNPNNPFEIWETTLHFMVFDRPMMENIEREITLDEYLSTNGVAEGEVFKWRNKYNLKTSPVIIKDKIFYWEDFDFFNYSPTSDFKVFLSKNEPMEVWLGEDSPYSETLPDNLRIVFHGFSKLDEITIRVNGVNYIKNPKAWEIIEFPISSQHVNELVFSYGDQIFDMTDQYNKIMVNQIYYNRK